MLVSWNVTKACNLKCEHCYRDAGSAAADELSLEEGKVLLADIYAAGFKLVIFSGGEPLLRADIYKLIEYARGLGLVCLMGTNGTLIDEKCARQLKKAGIKRVGISIDSVSALAHNEFRGSAQAWEKAVAGMEHCREAGLSFQVHTTVTKKNIRDVLSITDFAQDKGAAGHHIFFLVATGRGRNIDNVIPSADEYERLLEDILEKQKTVALELKPVCAPQFVRIARKKNIPIRFDKGCLAGTRYICVLPNGDVHPCPYLPLLLGNVRREGFRALWQESKVLDDLRRMRFEGKCGMCEFKKICSGCRAAAFYQSKGNYLAEDLNCNYEPQGKRYIKDIAV
ncbi:MAG: radical SAM protein [Candidatus Omnitrophica bacterium]|nr:radical SAM protein [Candidatus Omnitrophota bacterium]MBU4479387.1 radical SAM protein [Candidatus Omnitrophota bacterium]MCG2703231.1 radical SAM protein [Candidatus Omnitrophota bacterium]